MSTIKPLYAPGEPLWQKLPADDRLDDLPGSAEEWIQRNHAYRANQQIDREIREAERRDNALDPESV